MDKPLQTALKDLIENQASPEQIELLRQAMVSGQIRIGGNVRDSVIVVGSGNSIQISPEALDLLTMGAKSRAVPILHELPQPPADFVGRNEELKVLLANLEKNGGTAISGLIGMGGIGKTALGLVLAHSLLEKYPDAQFFIEMRGTSNDPVKPSEVMKYVVQRFDPKADLRNTTENELTGIYKSTISMKRTILFLDNVFDASQIMPLFTFKNSFLLITSRRHFTIPGLHSLRLDVLNENDGERLLSEICPRLTYEDVKRIAILCGYLPLALRIAGSYLEIHDDLTADEYCSQLANRAKRLSTLRLDGYLDGIDASFEHSYQLLFDDERRYWNMLAVFPTSFKRDALITLWDLEDERTRDLALKLRQYSLLEYDRATDRYRLHDLLIDFANTKLSEKDKETSILRYLRHYKMVWRISEEHYRMGGDHRTRGLQLFDSENVHIQFALEWAMKNADTNPEASSILADIPASLILAEDPTSLKLAEVQAYLNISNIADSSSVFQSRLPPKERLELFHAALESAEKLGDLSKQTMLLGNIGATYDDLAAYDKAIEYYERAGRIAKQIGDHEKEGSWLGNIGVAYSNLGKIPKALEYLEQAVKIARVHGNKDHESDSLNNIAMAYSALGETHRSIAYLLQALEITREVGNREKEGRYLGNIGAGYINLGEHRKALEYLEQALAIAREQSEKSREDFWLGTIGFAHMSLGEFNTALEYLEQALMIAREIGNRGHQHNWMGNIGLIYLELGEPQKATEYLEDALVSAREIDDRQSEGEWLGNIGTSYALRGETQEAKERLEQALAIAREVGGKWQVAQWQTQLGELYFNMKEPMKARKSLDEALQISKELGIQVLEATCLSILAKLSGSEQN